jgi:hypothetical protein
MELSNNFKGIMGEQIEIPSEETMSAMSHSQLAGLRNANSDNPKAQEYLAPYEHRAFSREWVSESGVNAIPLAIAIPAYSAAKATGVETIAKKAGLLEDDKQEATPTSLAQIKQGFIGIGEGLKAYFVKEESQPIIREVSPEVQKQLDIRSKVENILPSLIKTESTGKHRDASGNLIESEVGAKGITQVLPQTAKDPGYGIKPLQNDSKEEYIRFAKDYLGKMIHIFDNVEQGIAAYNAGPGAIHRAISKAQRTKRDWKEFIPKETKQYIQKVNYTPDSSEATSHKPQVTDVMGFRG